MTRASADATRRAITIADITVKNDGEERVSHKTLAIALGLTQHHKLRHLIERNSIEFERYGAVLSTMDETTCKGGRPGQLVWLNEGQAILAAVRSEAPFAPDVRYQVITAFMEYRRGKIDLVPVRAHERRTSTRVDDAIRLKKNIDRLERATADIQAIAAAKQPRYLSAMVIEGEPVVVDVTDYDIQPGERAVVVRWDGSMAVEVVSASADRKAFGERSAYGPSYKGSDGGTYRDVVIIVGKVFERREPERDQRLPTPANSRARGAEIIPLLRAGMTPMQVVARTGAHENTVYRWRRAISK